MTSKFTLNQGSAIKAQQPITQTRDLRKRKVTFSDFSYLDESEIEIEMDREEERASKSKVKSKAKSFNRKEMPIQSEEGAKRHEENRRLRQKSGVTAV